MKVQAIHPQGIFTAFLTDMSPKLDERYEPFWWLRFVTQHGIIYKPFTDKQAQKAHPEMVKRLVVGVNVLLDVQHVEVKGVMRASVRNIAVRNES